MSSPVQITAQSPVDEAVFAAAKAELTEALQSVEYEIIGMHSELEALFDSIAASEAQLDDARVVSLTASDLMLSRAPLSTRNVL